MRYYVDNSSYFDSHPYNRSKIAKAIKRGGGANVREACLYGWSNQPKVVTFSATPSALKGVQASVEQVVGTPWIIIRVKDW